jgi:hypothetical protein
MTDIESSITQVFLCFFFGGIALGLLTFVSLAVIIGGLLFLLFYFGEKVVKCYAFTKNYFAPGGTS